MATAKQIAANRANAQKSTGPKSAASKAKVSQNAVKHGLCGRFQVLATENQQDYNALLERFMQAEKPADDVERELVAKMARHTWLSERAVRYQEACFIIQPETPELKEEDAYDVGVRYDLDVYLRHMTTHDRAYQRAANDLAKRRAERAKAERGFVSQKRAEAVEIRKAEAHAMRMERQKWALQLDDLKILITASKLPNLPSPPMAQKLAKSAA